MGHMLIDYHRPAGPLALCLVLASCVGPSATDAPVGTTTLELSIQPALVAGPADATADPVNLIRAIVLRSADAVEVARVDVPVSPEAAEWELSVPVAIDSEVEVSVRLSLMNSIDGTESVQFSGITPPFLLSAGAVASPTDVSLVRGPLANLYVLGVFVTSTPADLLVGETGTASAALEYDTTAEGIPEVFWVSTDPSVATVDDSLVSAVSEGSTQLIAVSGAYADTVSMEVLPRYSSVTLSPDSVSVVGFGSTATYTASVLDGRGDPVSDPSLTWSSATPAVVTSTGSGVFEAVGLGNGQPQVALTDAPSVTGTAQMVVEPIVGDLGVRKTVSNGQPVPGDTVSFEVSLSNSANFPASDVVVLDTVPEGLAFVAATASVGSYDVSTHTWALDRMEAGAVETLSLTVEVVAGSDTITNRAHVVPPADYQDQDPANDMALSRVFTGLAPVGDPSGVIVFASDRDGSGRDVWLKDLDTGALTQLTTGAIFASGPDFSPDGSRIVVGDNADEVVVMSSDGTGLTSLTGPSPVQGSYAGSPTWSPDGAFVAYQGVTTDDPDDWEIVVVEVADTVNRVFLTVDATSNQFPDWSPDGTRLAFTRDRAAIYTILAADGTDERLVYQGSVLHPDWSPDGTEIAFQSGSAILAVDVSTLAVRTILNDGANNWGPVWSPDGAWIMVYKQPATGGSFQLWAVRTDGSQEQVQLDVSNGSDHSGGWTTSIPPG